jgi:hypothetical protein
MLKSRISCLNGPESYLPFRDEFNALVKEYNTYVHEHYGRLHARTDIAPAIIGAIDAQPYTGRPVIVIPSVSLRKTAADGTQTPVEFVFSEDFTVSYRNNVEPGTATLLIEGIGHYRGAGRERRRTAAYFPAPLRPLRSLRLQREKRDRKTVSCLK